MSPSSSTHPTATQPVLSTPPPGLRHAFRACPWAELRAIATRLGLHGRTLRHKQDWADTVAAFWTTTAACRPILSQLSPPAQDALARLLTYSRTPAALFLAEFGTIRRARQAQPPLPWRHPVSPAEELFYVGLLHGDAATPVHRAAHFILPTALHPTLHQWLAERPPATHSARRFVPSSPDLTRDPTAVLLHDLTHLLAYENARAAHRPDFALAHHCWLSRADLHALNQRLLKPEPTPLPRHHRQSNRLRFLQFWAIAAGLQADGRLTSAGYEWCRLQDLERARLLWQAWLGAPPELRTRFALPDARLPLPWPDLLQQALAAHHQPFSAAQLAATLLNVNDAALTYWTANIEDVRALETLADDLLTGPLREFGIVAAHLGPVLVAHYSLTALGRQLLNGETRYAAASPVAQPAILPTPEAQSPERLSIHLPPSVSGLPIITLELFATYAGRVATAQDERHRYDLTPVSLRRAAVAERPLTDLWATFAALNLPLPPAWETRLHDWYESAPVLTLGPAPLLRVENPETLRSVLNDPHLRDHVAEVLSPTAALVASAEPDAIARFHAQGYRVSGRPPVRSGTAPADAGALWLAGQVYSELGQHLTLPAPPPFAELETLYQALAPARQAALQIQLAEIADQLRAALDGVCTAPGVLADPETWRPAVESALAAGQCIELQYFTPARNLIARYRLHPYWLERWRGRDYLRAECLTTGRVRLFRLDRIQALTILDELAGPSPQQAHP